MHVQSMVVSEWGVIIGRTIIEFAGSARSLINVKKT